MSAIRLLGVVRPRHATVVAYLALTVALSGAAYAAGTIGSKDIIDGSIQSVDLKDGAAVRGIDVVDNSLTGADINEGSLVGVAHKLLMDRHTDDRAIVTIGTIATWTLKGKCYPSGDQGSIFFDLYVDGPGEEQVGADVSDADNLYRSFSSGAFLAKGHDTLVLTAGAGENLVGREWGTIWLRSGQTIAEVDFHALVDGSGQTCLLYGTMTSV